jgi:hypothetical protein
MIAQVAMAVFRYTRASLLAFRALQMSNRLLEYDIID